MNLTESCVVEQHKERILRMVKPNNMGLATPDVALIVRAVRWWAARMSMDLENACGRAHRSTCQEAARLVCPQPAVACASHWETCDTRNLGEVR